MVVQQMIPSWQFGEVKVANTEVWCWLEKRQTAEIISQNTAWGGAAEILFSLFCSSSSPASLYFSRSFSPSGLTSNPISLYISRSLLLSLGSASKSILALNSQCSQHTITIPVLPWRLGTRRGAGGVVFNILVLLASRRRCGEERLGRLGRSSAPKSTWGDGHLDPWKIANTTRCSGFYLSASEIVPYSLWSVVFLTKAL